MGYSGATILFSRHNATIILIKMDAIILPGAQLQERPHWIHSGATLLFSRHNTTIPFSLEVAKLIDATILPGAEPQDVLQIFFLASILNGRNHIARSATIGGRTTVFWQQSSQNGRNHIARSATIGAPTLDLYCATLLFSRHNATIILIKMDATILPGAQPQELPHRIQWRNPIIQQA